MKDLRQKFTSTIKNTNSGDQSYQLFWEFEVWKKTEEITFKQSLKEKEEEHMTNISEKYRLLEKNREVAFSKAISEISSLESKLRNKINELQKRETSLGMYENELTRKIEESIKQVSSKDEEIIDYKNQISALRKELSGIATG